MYNGSAWHVCYRSVVGEKDSGQFKSLCYQSYLQQGPADGLKAVVAARATVAAAV
jgi:hypothetical protein